MSAGGAPAYSTSEVAAALYRMIVADELYVDLERDELALARRARVFADAAAGAAFAHRRAAASATGLDTEPAPVVVKPGAVVQWGQARWLIGPADAERIWLVPQDEGPDGIPVPLTAAAFDALVADGAIRGLAPAPASRLDEEARWRVAAAGPDEYAEANRRLGVIAPALAPGRRLVRLGRTGERYLAAYREAAERWGDGYLGLLPEPAAGNRSAHPVAVSDEELETFAVTVFDRPHAPSELGALRILASWLRKEGRPCPSKKRWYAFLRRRQTHAVALARLGSRGAYGSEPYLTLAATTPPHGQRPWERAHLDHTELDIELVDAECREILLGRPWLTLLIDAYSRRILAAWISFDPPSYRSDLMALRLCVKRHGRLPQTIITDQGSDFGSTWYEQFLARYRVTKEERPAHKPRFGSVIERLFGVANTQFVWDLVGNTKALRNPRAMSRSTDPRLLACLDLDQFTELFSRWAYEVYDQIPHPALGRSPRSAFEAGSALAGDRPARRIAYDADFVIATLPTTAKGTLRAAHGRLRFSGRTYSHPALALPRVDGTDVAVRYDPWDLGYLLALADDRWVRAACDDPSLAGLSEKALMIASAELVARVRARERNGRDLDADLGDLLEEARLVAGDAKGPGRAVAQQRRRDDAIAASLEREPLLVVVPEQDEGDERHDTGQEDEGEFADEARGADAAEIEEYGRYL